MDNGFITEELNIGDDLDELIETGINMNELDDINIYYSYPYFSDERYDFQYRLFIDNGEFILEDIKCDETDMETDSSVVVINTYPRCDLKKGLDIISNNYDFRQLDNNEGMTISSDMINYDSSEDIENNKKIVLLELYKTIF
jgi:hypothetical protein